ncbi:hypothetical protein MCECM63_00905 [Methylophilaceae bacterium]
MADLNESLAAITVYLSGALQRIIDLLSEPEPWFS